MKWSWTLGWIAGIKIRMHWTFLLLLAWVGFSFGAQGGATAAMEAIAFVLAIFGCVVLHECGHALMARRYGVPTRDITLLPIGGVARMQRIPDVPMQEFWIALAGPAVNVVIAAVILVGLLVSGQVTSWDALISAISDPSWGQAFFFNLMFVNLIIVAFNALPAFPMDGGRVLRSLLALRIDYARATRLAANIGQIMAIFFGFLGLFTNPLLLLIAIFVYLGAESEAQAVEIRSSLQGMTVQDAMMSRFQSLSPEDSLRVAAKALLEGAQQDFPVYEDGSFYGILTRQRLIEGLQSDGPDGEIRNWSTREQQTVTHDQSLVETLDKMRESNLDAIPVFEDDTLIGILSKENVSELIMVRSASEGHPTNRQVADPANVA